jgi:hypothetical protein
MMVRTMASGSSAMLVTALKFIVSPPGFGKKP